MLLLYSVLVSCLLSCEGLTGLQAGGNGKNDIQSEAVTIVSWNSQTLFDGEEHGTEYSDYLPSEGWNTEKFNARLLSLGEAIQKIGKNGPDILALQEVENPAVLELLAEKALSGSGYGHSFFSKSPGTALGIGIISRFPLSSPKVHAIVFNGEAAPRPVLEIWIELENSPIVLFICHWKSKLGGDSTTETLRRASARIILRRLKEIENQTPGIPVLIMGDLNENHDEFYRQAGNYICAILPDDPKAAELAMQETVFRDSSEEAGYQGDFLIISAEKPPKTVYFPGAVQVFYSPWEQELKNGSYYYKNEWETIDHLLFSPGWFDDAGWEFDSCAVVDTPPFTSVKGVPVPYNPRTGYGLSDHLPLMATIKKSP
ncbi:endonuclease/exonuclease/phosphatase family protein [Breznakiella homolactica]|uniref:Endonuclease/exonuclease/phosphatase family protein n=2 Tax=Breznakiella homolactica TaxID=2798577 RepID=A0A7T7XRT0_9SPIR|nr:endonuclease/exonuclease/phosphatase family protein [Breznakiella homolactica]